MRSAIFIDKDGTIIPDIPFNADPELIVLENGVSEGLRRLSAQGYLTIIITNQSGIAHGFIKEEQLTAVEAHICQLLINESIRLDGFYYCPHYPGAIIKKYDQVCSCRKPLPGMILQAAADFNIDLSHSWMIGDILNDVESGNRAGCKTILIDNGNETEWLMDNAFRVPSFIARDIKEAASFILNAVKLVEETDADTNAERDEPGRNYTS